jgi:DNA-binding transcriptional MerR regulator
LASETIELLRPDELEQIERDHAQGVSAPFIVHVFETRGARLSQATFRKYVQAGLLPRSRRVGRKGKHRGSQGLYPVESVRKINAIKKMMAAGLTLEDIKTSFVVHTHHIEASERELAQVFDALEKHLVEGALGEPRRRALQQQLHALRARARELYSDVARLGSVITARPARREDA